MNSMAYIDILFDLNFFFKTGTKKGPSHCITVFQGARQLLGCVHSCIFLVLHSSVNDYFK